MSALLAIATILGGLAAVTSVIVWLRTALARRGEQRRFFKTGALIRPAVSGAPPKQLAIIDALLDDLQLDGPMRGQFGRRQDSDEQARFLQPGESAPTKPSLYLTYWPTAVLADPTMPTFVRARTAPAIRLVQTSLREALADGGMHVAMGAGHALPPNAPGHSVVSYRHTVRAAHTLYSIDSHDPVALGVLGRLISPGSTVVHTDGGWQLCDRDFVEVDLWTTAYGVAYVDEAIANHHFSSDPKLERHAEKLLRGSLKFLSHDLVSRGWSYGEVTSGENAVLLASEVGPAALARRPELAARILRLLRQCVDDAGAMTPWYLHESTRARPAQAAVRLAFAFTRVGVDLAELPLLGETVHSLAPQGLNAAELAMLVSLLVRGRPRPDANTAS